MNTVINGMNISYPDLGFAFNPLRITIDNYTLDGPVIFESNGNIIEREPYEGETSVSLELNSIAKSLFDRLQFYKVQETDTTLIKSLDFVLSFPDGSTLNGTIPVMWGALQIGETYTQNKTLTYFKGFPFTVPIYTEGRTVLKVNGIEYKTLEAGKYNIDISGIASSGILSIKAFDEFQRKIFDYTFDSTFGPQRIFVPNGLDIKVNIVNCPNQGVYLRWINKYGEYNYYLFQGSNQSTTTKNNTMVFDNIFYTTALTDNYHHGTGKSIGKDVEQTNKLYADLVDPETFDILLSLTESPVVDMFTGYDSNNKANWISISVAEGTFAKTTSHLQDFELFIVPNKRQIQIL